MLEYLPRQRLHGGIRLATHKAASTGQPILRGFVPERVVLSTRQHRGAAARPVVEPGQHVLRGDLVALGNGIAVPGVHASTSGTVRCIEPRAVPSFTGVETEICVVIECDGEHRTGETGRRGPWPSSRAGQLERIAEAGIVGLGGALFPASLKLGSEGCRMLIVNGAECEPHISCDDMLMREAAEEIVDGTLLMSALLGSESNVIAIERDKPEAINAMRAAIAACGDDRIQLAELPTIYPAGGERQLIEVLTGRQVPSDAYPSDIGFVCQNVGTAHALHQLVRHCEPLCSRIVTVSGGAVVEPRNVDVPIGTPIAELIALCGGYRAHAARLVHGGSMMGFALPSDDLPVTKSTNCLIAASLGEIRTDFTEWPCIRCGECAIACPVRLAPQDLLGAARNPDFEALHELGLEDCIECGCCDVVCPSHIPLTEDFRDAKRAFAAHEKQRALSAASDQRYHEREERQRRAQAAEQQRQEKLQKAARGEGADEAIRAAVARARSRKPGQEGADE